MLPVNNYTVSSSFCGVTVDEAANTDKFKGSIVVLLLIHSAFQCLTAVLVYYQMTATVAQPIRLQRWHQHTSTCTFLPSLCRWHCFNQKPDYRSCLLTDLAADCQWPKTMNPISIKHLISGTNTVSAPSSILF